MKYLRIITIIACFFSVSGYILQFTFPDNSPIPNPTPWFDRYILKYCQGSYVSFCMSSVLLLTTIYSFTKKTILLHVSLILSIVFFFSSISLSLYLFNKGGVQFIINGITTSYHFASYEDLYMSLITTLLYSIPSIIYYVFRNKN